MKIYLLFSLNSYIFRKYIPPHFRVVSNLNRDQVDS